MVNRYRRRWYENFGIEQPFPWMLVALYLTPPALVLAALVLASLL